jgi:anti-anti-sigma factor
MWAVNVSLSRKLGPRHADGHWRLCSHPGSAYLFTEASVPFTLSLLGKDPAGVVHVAAHGDAQTTDFGASKLAHFDGLLGSNWAESRVVLNMENVPYVVSAAIGWLLTSQKGFRAAGGTLVLHSVQPAVANVLKLLKVERVIPIATDEGGAMAMLQGDPARPPADQAA